MLADLRKCASSITPLKEYPIKRQRKLIPPSKLQTPIKRKISKIHIGPAKLVTNYTDDLTCPGRPLETQKCTYFVSQRLITSRDFQIFTEIMGSPHVHGDILTVRTFCMIITPAIKCCVWWSVQLSTNTKPITLSEAWKLFWYIILSSYFYTQIR